MDFRMKKSGDPGILGDGCSVRFAKAITWIWVAKCPSKKCQKFGQIEVVKIQCGCFQK